MYRPAARPFLKNWTWRISSQGRKELIAGINHMGWLLKLEDRDGNDLYPEIRRRARGEERLGKHNDMVRLDYIEKFGYYCTESSEHNSEYNMFLHQIQIPGAHWAVQHPLDEYPPPLRQPDRGLGQGTRRTAQEPPAGARAFQGIRFPHHGIHCDGRSLQDRRQCAQRRRID